MRMRCTEGMHWQMGTGSKGQPVRNPRCDPERLYDERLESGHEPKKAM